MSTYQFTAYMESDLLSGSNTDIGVGDTFTLPQFSSVTMTVTDDDLYLSGDSVSNEQANDSTGQTATIIDDAGAEVGNGGQIYAEQYFWVYDQYGNWYIMVEIEQEGASGDYFVFYNSGGYATPPADAILTIDSSCNVTSDWLEYCNLEGGEMPVETGSLGGRLFIDADGSNTEWNSETNSWEEGAEGMTVTLYKWDGSTGVQVATTTTSADGSYSFGDLEGGWYYVAFTKPDGTEFVQQNVGNDYDDSDANSAGFTAWVWLGAGQDIWNVDAGVTAPPPPAGAISGTVFDDADGDGVQDQGATGGETLGANLIVNGDFETNALNNSGGNVNVITAGWQDIGFNKVAIHEQDYGLANSIGDAVAKLYMNTVLRQDVSISEGGDYRLSFDVMRNYKTGDADNTFALYIDGAHYANYTVTTNQRIEIDLDLGAGAHSIEFRGLGSSYHGAGIDDVSLQQVTVTAGEDAEAGVAGVTVYLLDASGNEVLDANGQPVTTVTDANGDYTFEGVDAGDYKVRFEAPDGSEFTIQDAGSDDSVDSDVDASGSSGVITVTGGQTTDVDAGLVVSPNAAPDAVDDFFVTDEETAVSGNVLANDSDPDGDPISVVAVEGGNVGEAFEVTTANGYTGSVTLNADGSFSFTPGANFQAMAEGEQDSFDLTYTIADQPDVAQMTNVLFVLDISNSTTGTTGDAEDLFNGVGVGDVNGDGLFDTVLDAEIAAVISAVNKMLADGVNPSMVDIGIVTFSGVVDATKFTSFNYPTEDATTVGTWSLDAAALIEALSDIQSGGWTNYEAGLQEAESWLAANADAGEANKVVFLSDGRPIVTKVYNETTGVWDDVYQDASVYGDEVANISNTYGAEIHAIGVGANSDLAYLNDLDNTGGAEQVLDAADLTVAVETAAAMPKMDTATITVTINGLNDLADGDETAEVSEASGATALADNALANTDDPDGGAPVIETLEGVALNGSSASAAGTAGGVFTFNADGTVSFNTNGEFAYLSEGQEVVTAVTYEVSDGQGGLVSSTYSVVVRGTEGEPIIDAMDDLICVFEDEGANDVDGNVLDNDDLPYVGSNLVVEVNGQTGLVGEWIDLAGGGRVKLNADGNLDFDANGAYDSLGAGESAFENLTYTVRSSDGTQDSVVAIFEGPNGLSATAEIVELNGELVVTLTVQTEGGDIGDIRGFFFDVSDESLLGGMSATGADITDQEFEANNVFNLGGGNNVNGDIIIELGKFDGGVTSGTQGMSGDDIRSTTFTLSHDSVALTLDLLLNQDMALRLTSVGEDGGERGDSLKLGSVGLPSTSDSLVDTATVTVEVKGINEGPDAIDDVAETDEETAVSGNILSNDTDPNGDALTVTGVSYGNVGEATSVTTDSGNFSGSLTVNADGSFTFTPDAGLDALAVGDVETVTFTYDITDGNGGADTATVMITINGLNEGPDAVDDAVATDEDTAIGGNILANDTDPNGDALTVTGVSYGNVGEATSVTTDSGNFSGSLTVNADGSFTFTPDAGLDALAVGDVETVTFTYDITDGNGGADTATVTITVNGLNEPPVALDDSISIAEDGVIAEVGNDEAESLNILANDSDPNGDSLTVAAIAGGLVGAAFSVVTAGGRTVSVTVNANGDLLFDTSGQFEALAAGETDSFQLTYTADDGNGGQDEAVVTVIINGDNEPPVAVNDSVTVNEDGAVGVGDDAEVLNVLTNDSDPNGDALTVTTVNGVAAGTPVTVTSANGVTTEVIITSAGEVQFTTDGAFDDLALGDTDSITVTYQISDGNGGTDTATATITIEGLNEPPVAADDAIAINEGDAVDPSGAITLNVLANDSDPNGDALTVASVNGAAAGTPVTVTTANGVTTTATIAANGDVTFDTAGLFDDLNDGESDSFTLSYTADDGNGGQDDATVTITINGEGAPQGDTSYNIVFLVDSAGALGSASTIADAIIGSAGSLDLNGDGVFNSLLDAELFIVQQMNAELASLGLGSDVEMGLYTFDTELGFGVTNEEASQLTAGATGANGTFTAGDDLSAAFGEAATGAVSSYNTAVAGANDFFAFASTNDTGSTTVNLVYMLTDGDGFDWTFGGDDPLSTELTTLTGTYGAEMDTILVNAANAGSTLIAQIESVAGDGTTNVLDSEADVNTYVSGLGSDLIV